MHRRGMVRGGVYDSGEDLEMNLSQFFVLLALMIAVAVIVMEVGNDLHR